MKQPSTCMAIACLIVLLTGQSYAGTRRAAVKARRHGHVASPSADRHLAQLALDWKAAYNRKDAEKLSLFYTEDAYYISSHVPGLVAEGRQQIKAYFRRGMDAGGHIDAVQILRGGSASRMAYCVCLYEATNSGQKVSGRNMLVLKKVGRRWLIASHVTVVAE